MPDVLDITLGGQTFRVRPLTLRQLRDLQVGIVSTAAAPDDPAAQERIAFDQMVEGLAAALRRDHPDMTADAILDREGTFLGLRDAYRAVLVHSGLVPPGEPAAASSGGATSTGS